MALGKTVKRIGLAFGILIGLILLVIIVVPFFINVDDYRPKIEQAVNEKINGKLTLGKMQLSLWGQIKIRVGSFELTDHDGRGILTGREVFFHMPFLSVLRGAPELTFVMRKPEVQIVKNKNGKLNVLTLLKPAPEGTAPPPPPPTKPGTASDGGVLPAMVINARMGIELRDALLFYNDETTALISQVRDLNVILKDLSLSGKKPVQMDMWANLDTKMGKTMVLHGPVRIQGTATPKFKDGRFEEASVGIIGDASDVEVMMPGVFEKKKGVAATAAGDMLFSLLGAKLTKLRLTFLNAEIATTAQIIDFEDPMFELRLKSNEIILKPWADLLPPLRAYDLGGAATFEAVAGGPADELKYQAQLALKNVTAKAPMLKAEPRIDGSVKIMTDQVESMAITMKAPGNDIAVTGKVLSFSKPRIDVNVKSTSLDLDQLLDTPKPAAAAGGQATPPPAAKTSTEPADAEAKDMDKLLDPLRKNEVLGALVAAIRFNLQLVKYNGLKITNMGGAFTMRNLGVALEGFSMNMWEGSVKAGLSAQLRPERPTYKFSTDVTKLNLAHAMETHMELLKNTLKGRANFKMEATGSSFNTEMAKSNLNAKGSMKVEQANFATLDIGKIATDAVNKSMDKIAGSVPLLKGKAIKPPGNIDSKYEYISSDFTISGGRFITPNFVGKAEKDKGIDLRGELALGLKDYALIANWELIDTYNLTKARDLNVDAGSARVDHILAEGNGPVRFPVRVTGTAMAPVVSYGAVPEALAKVAANNINHAATGKAKAEAQKHVTEQLKKVNAPPAVNNAVQGLGKKLFGN